MKMNFNHSQELLKLFTENITNNLKPKPLLPSAPSLPVSSLLDLSASEQSYFDFLHEPPPNDQEHNENVCNSEHESLFDSTIFPYDFQLNPTSWGENSSSVVPLSDSTFTIKYAGALARFGAFPDRSGRDKDTINAEVKKLFQEVTFEL